MKWLFVFSIVFPMTLLGQVQVENPKALKGTGYRLVFEEDLRIGDDCEDDDCLWTGSNVDVSVNKKGHMFVTDPGGNRIVVYDAQGNHLKTFGQKGQGPGEFSQLYSYTILTDQSGVAFDNNQTVIAFSFFDQNQKYVDKKTIQPGKRFIQAAKFAPSGKVMGAMYVDINSSNPGTPGTVHTGLLNPETEPIMTFSEGTQVMFDQTRMTDSQWWSKFLSEWFQLVHKGVGTIGFGTDHKVYSAMTTTYEITQYNADLKPQMVIKKAYKPKPLPQDQLMAFVEPVHEEIAGILPPELRSMVTTAVVKKALELAEFPPRKQPIYALLPVEDKGLLVIHDHNPLTGKTTADFFSPKGVFQGVTELPPIDVNIFAGFFGSATNVIFQNGFAYTMISDDSGDRHLVRYKYRIEKIDS